MITMAWAWYTMPGEEELEQQRQEQVLRDSLAALQQPVDTLSEGNNENNQAQDQAEQTADRPLQDTLQPELRQPGDTSLGIFSQDRSDTVYTMVRTPLFELEFTNLGAGPARVTMQEHETWDNNPVQMVRNTTRSAYSLGFLSTENLNIETDRLFFEPLTDTGSIEISEDETAELSYRLAVNDSSAVLFTYTFNGNSYIYDLDITFENMSPLISGTIVDFGWKSALNYTERDLSQDKLATAAYTYAGGVLEKFQLEAAGRNEQTINGTIEWVSTRTRFFGQYIKPVTNSNAAVMIGEITGEPGQPGSSHYYQSRVQSSISGTPSLSYELYNGPLKYYDLKEFHEHAYDVVEIGYALIRWFADPLVRYVIIPFFALGSTIIPNYGILVIIFGVMVKLVLFPLTQKSFKSMAAMRELQPQMKEIQEKFKDEPQKQQKETIALYKKAKVNPLGGCLPMVLQFPILITMFFFFQNSMLMRQESFLWASDLSAPDYFLSLPISIPFLGDQLAGFVLLMAAAMFLQTKVSGGMSGGAAPSGGPNMKAFTYIMPFMLLFIFNNFAAGLSLYYLVYNVLSVAQQVIINKQIATKKPEELEKAQSSAEKKLKKGKKKK